jgi:hypothetical protein
MAGPSGARLRSGDALSFHVRSVIEGSKRLGNLDKAEPSRADAILSNIERTLTVRVVTVRPGAAVRELQVEEQGIELLLRGRRAHRPRT